MSELNNSSDVASERTTNDKEHNIKNESEMETESMDVNKENSTSDEQSKELKNDEKPSENKETAEDNKEKTDEVKKTDEVDEKENSHQETIGGKENRLDDREMRRDAANRVKLYVLCDQRAWEDRGTGHVMCVSAPDDDAPSNSSSFMIMVRLEQQDKNVLESRILMDTVYQKQQETLIVWSETEIMDLALSFQEKNGCEELWAKICEVQGRDPGDGDAVYDDGDDSDVSELTSSSSRLALPPIEIGRLSEIDALIQMHLSTNASREKMATAIENESVLPKLCEVFRMCEDIEHTEGLKTFYSIAKNLFMLNRASMIEILLDDKYVKDLIGMFEYDPTLKTPKKHRDFVFKKARFREVLNISSEDVKEKIHKLYRAQYIQDACLPSLGLFEENLLSSLNSHILFCRVEIITLLQKDKKAMRELFGQLRSNDTSSSRRRDLVLFLKEMLTLSQNLHGTGVQSKEAFFRNIMGNDVLECLEPCMKSEDTLTRIAIIEVLKSLVDNNPHSIRDFLLKQARDNDDEDVLLNRLINHMLTDKDPHLSSGTEVILILKSLLDPDNISNMKSDRNEFLQLFYHRCIHILLKPMMENISGGFIKHDDYTTANRHSIMVRLLSFCIEHHTFAMRQHCISTDLLNKILVLLKSKHQFLALYSLKLLHRVITVKDDYYVRYIVREKVLDPVFEFFKKNGTRYNVLNSAMIHLFDCIKTEDIRPLIKYIVENHSDVIESVNYVRTFKEIKNRYEQHREREETMSIRSEDNSMASPRGSRKDRQEDQWFEEDDDMDVSMMETDKNASPKKEEVTPRKTGMEPMFLSVLKRKNAFDDDEAPVFGGSAPNTLTSHEKKIVIKVKTDRSPSRTPSPATSPRVSPGPSREDEVTSSQNNSKENSPAPTVKSLVDYDESDSDEEETSPDAVPSSSTGSPETEKPPSDAKKASDSPEYNDVSSTSSEDKDNHDETNDNKDIITTTTTPADSSRKRTSDGLDPISAVKRCRTDEPTSEA